MVGGFFVRRKEKDGGLFLRNTVKREGSVTQHVH